MKRKAFILTEILTGMMLQALFALTLCGAFYLITGYVMQELDFTSAGVLREWPELSTYRTLTTVT